MTQFWLATGTSRWPWEKTRVTLRHPIELGNSSAWDAIEGLNQVDSSLTILTPYQCHDAYSKALPKMEVCVDHTVLIMHFAAMLHIE